MPKGLKQVHILNKYVVQNLGGHFVSSLKNYFSLAIL